MADSAQRIEQFDGDSRANGAAATSAALKGKPRSVSNPATTETIYTDEDAALLSAVRAYQDKAGRKHLAFTEIRDILLEMGYRRPE